MRLRLMPLVLISAVSLQFGAKAYALTPNDLNSQQWFLGHPTTPILGIRAVLEPPLRLRLGDLGSWDRLPRTGRGAQPGGSPHGRTRDQSISRAASR